MEQNRKRDQKNKIEDIAMHQIGTVTTNGQPKN